MNTPLYLATLPSPGSCSCGVVGGLLTENIALSKHSGAILFFLSYKIFDPKKKKVNTEESREGLREI